MPYLLICNALKSWETGLDLAGGLEALKEWERAVTKSIDARKAQLCPRGGNLKSMCKCDNNTKPTSFGISSRGYHHRTLSAHCSVPSSLACIII
jgi:hypothetical protein